MPVLKVKSASLIQVHTTVARGEAAQDIAARAATAGEATDGTHGFRLDVIDIQAAKTWGLHQLTTCIHTNDLSRWLSST